MKRFAFAIAGLAATVLLALAWWAAEAPTSPDEVAARAEARAPASTTPREADEPSTAVDAVPARAEVATSEAKPAPQTVAPKTSDDWVDFSGPGWAQSVHGRVLLDAGIPPQGLSVRAIRPESHLVSSFATVHESQGEPRFALPMELPQKIVIEVLPLGRTEPIFSSPAYEVPSGFHGTFPELDPIDLRGKLTCYSLYCVDARDGTAVTDAYAFVDDGHRISERFTGDPIRVVAGTPGLQVVVRAAGHRATQTQLVAGEQRVSLERAMNVTLMLPSDLPRLPQGAKLEVHLALRSADAAARSFSPNSGEAFAHGVRGVFDSSGETEVALEVDGDYAASFTLRNQSRFQQFVSNLAGPEQPVHLSALEGRATIEPARAAYLELLRSLR